MAVYNPRRRDWDPNFGDAQMLTQINWELDCIAQSDIVAMYFDPKTTSPVTLLELGLVLKEV